MPNDSLSTARRVWLGLLGLTGITWLLGEGSPVAWGTPALMTGALLMLAFVKASLVILYFMELRHAGAPLRWAYLGWVVIVGLLVVVGSTAEVSS